MVEAHTQEIASLKTTEPTVNSFEEGYEYNQYSNTCDQEWMDQSSFSYMDKDFQISQYDDQQQFQQQYYQEQFEQPPLQHYQYPPLQQELQVPPTNVDVPPDQTSEVWDMFINLQKSFEENNKVIQELKTQQRVMETQIAELANSSATWQPDSLPLSSIQPEDYMNAIILTSDQEYDSFSICVDDVTIEIEDEHANDDAINNVVVQKDASEDKVDVITNICPR